MNHKTAIPIAALIAVLAAPQAHAHAAKFQGFSAELDYDSTKTKTDWQGSNTAGNTFRINGDVNQGAFSIAGTYQHAFGERFLLGVGAKLGLGEQAHGITTGGRIKYKDAQSFFINPGIAITDKTMVYGKLGQSFKNASFGHGTLNLGGNTFGFGVRHHFSPNLFLSAEYTKTDYGSKNFAIGAFDKTRFEHKEDNYTVGVGYLF